MSASVCSLRVAIIIWDINWSVSWYWAGQTSLNKEVNLGHYTQSTEFKQNTIKNIFFFKKIILWRPNSITNTQLLYDGLVWCQGDCHPVHPCPSPGGHITAFPLQQSSWPLQGIPTTYVYTQSRIQHKTSFLSNEFQLPIVFSPS